jgi:hypothetical protein
VNAPVGSTGVFGISSSDRASALIGTARNPSELGIFDRSPKEMLDAREIQGIAEEMDMDEWVLLLKLMVEPRQYRPERPIAPITQKAAAPNSLSSSDRKLLDDYAQAVQRCGTGRVVLDNVSGFYVPEFDGTCIAEKDAATITPTK